MLICRTEILSNNASFEALWSPLHHYFQLAASKKCHVTLHLDVYT